MKKALFICLLSLTLQFCKAQDVMTVLPDSSGKELFSDFLGVRLWAADYGINSINKDLAFKFVSTNTGFTMNHGFDVRGITNTPNLGIGAEENLGKHFLIHFVDASLGYSMDMWNWNIGAGVGYFISLDKRNKVRLRGCVDLFYEDISFSLGTYYDTTLQGFIVNGNNIGTSIKNVKYVSNSLNASFSVSLLYRAKDFDYFAGIGYNYIAIWHEKINFYSTKIDPSEAVYDSQGNPSDNILKLGSYVIQIGIMREFGL